MSWYGTANPIVLCVMKIPLLLTFACLTVSVFAQDVPADVEKRAVTIWSDGTKMAGDLYLPKDRNPDEKLPAVVFCSGTGGTKKGSPARLGPRFARAGFVFLGFDNRGWGESESQIFVTGAVSLPDEKGEVTVKGKPIRWQMNFADQTADIRCAIAFVAGEPGIDPDRIGIMGSSYGGGLVTWVAANDPRVKCVAAQVPGMGGMRGEEARKRAFNLQARQARGEAEPIPFETGKLGGKMAGYANMRVNPAKNIGFNAIEAAENIRVPMILIDAENAELMDRRENGGKVAGILQANGAPVEYHVIRGIAHYGIYREGFEQATKLELEWFTKHLKAARQP
jgi:dienelactone hydrolase